MAALMAQVREQISHRLAEPSSREPLLELMDQIDLDASPRRPGAPAPRTLREIEMDHILRVLDKHGGNKPAAAAELGIVLKTLYNKLNQWQEERAKTAG